MGGRLCRQSDKIHFPPPHNSIIITDNLRRPIVASRHAALDRPDNAATLDSLLSGWGVRGVLSPGLRARIVQHLAFKQLQPAVRRRRRNLAADDAYARRA